jgi:S1-C subfamily serine protease
MRVTPSRRDNQRMDTPLLSTLSTQMADAVAAVAPSVVQVQGGRRPASGIAYDRDVILTSGRALAREDGLHVATTTGTSAAELVGWDPASGLAVLRTTGLTLTPAAVADATPRVGQIVLPIARSWSNALTASAGIIAVIGGPLRTGRGRAIDQIIRITAPMHDGFAGGAVADADGRIIGIATSARIRGLAVVVPATIAWKSAAHVLEHGRPRVGFLGVSGQRVRLDDRQQGDAGVDRGLLVVGVTRSSPADSAGVLIGDVIVALDGHAIASADDLLALLSADRIGRQVPVRVLRGGAVRTLTVTIGERPAS